MRAKIFCRTGKFQGLERLFEGDISIGRAKDNGAQLDDTSVSGYHARIHYDQSLQCYTLADTNSRNGTRLDGQRLKNSEALEDLHIISIAGKYDLIFQDLTHQDETAVMRTNPSRSATNPESNPEPKAPQEAVFPAVEVAPDKTIVEGDIITPPSAPPALELGSMTIADKDILPPPSIAADEIDKTQNADLDRTMADSNFSAPPLPPTPAPKAFVVTIGSVECDLADGEFSVGRVAGNHIVINENSISRRHATIRVSGEEVSIEDSGSKNGVRVDGVRIDSKTVITSKSEVFLGDVPLSIKQKV